MLGRDSRAGGKAPIETAMPMMDGGAMSMMDRGATLSMMDRGAMPMMDRGATRAGARSALRTGSSARQVSGQGVLAESSALPQLDDYLVSSW